MKWARRILLGLVTIGIVAYLGVLGMVYGLQRELQYAPSGEITALDTIELPGAEVVEIAGEDGVKVTGWYAPAENGMPTIVYYKGNYGSFSAEHERFVAWAGAGYGFVAFDYRGFPLSPGAISEDAILSDSLMVFDWAAERSEATVIWGRSLGTGPATFVASQRNTGALFLETPFLSAVGVAAERYPYLPVHWLMQDQFHTNEWIADVDEPIRIAHGTNDSTIPVSHGERLYDLAPNPDGLWIVEGGRHGNL